MSDRCKNCSEHCYGSDIRLQLAWGKLLNVGLREEPALAIPDNRTIPPVTARLGGVCGKDQVLAETYNRGEQ